VCCLFENTTLGSESWCRDFRGLSLDLPARAFGQDSIKSKTGWNCPNQWRVLPKAIVALYSCYISCVGDKVALCGNNAEPVSNFDPIVRKGLAWGSEGIGNCFVSQCFFLKIFAWSRVPSHLSSYVTIESYWWIKCVRYTILYFSTTKVHSYGRWTPLSGSFVRFYYY
jgi:hypothetical protein